MPQLRYQSPLVAPRHCVPPGLTQQNDEGEKKTRNPTNKQTHRLQCFHSVHSLTLIPSDGPHSQRRRRRRGTLMNGWPSQPTTGCRRSAPGVLVNEWSKHVQNSATMARRWPEGRTNERKSYGKRWHVRASLIRA